MSGSSIDSEIQGDYEEIVLRTFRANIMQSLAVFVGEPQAGFSNRIFRKANHEMSEWEQYMGADVTEVEVDFFGHVENDLKELPDQVTPCPDNKIVVTILECPVKKYEVDGNTTVSPTATSPTVDLKAFVKYALGEVTMGGDKSLKAKLKQLEVDCCVACMKKGTENVLNAVAFIAVIGPHDKGTDIKNYLNSNATFFPKCYRLYTARRLIYVQNASKFTFKFLIFSYLLIDTTTVRLARVEQQLHSIAEEMKEAEERAEERMKEAEERAEERMKEAEERIVETQEIIRAETQAIIRAETQAINKRLDELKEFLLKK
jgi:hypothetical protein